MLCAQQYEIRAFVSFVIVERIFTTRTLTALSNYVGHLTRYNGIIERCSLLNEAPIAFGESANSARHKTQQFLLFLGDVCSHFFLNCHRVKMRKMLRLKWWLAL
jgi:hypothetical protein